MDSDIARDTAGTVSVLVVEDHALVRNLVVQLLKGAGYHPYAVCDADQAFALWSKTPGRFDLVITDILMPSALDGLTLGRLIQMRQPDLPILYISGSENPDHSPALVRGQTFFRKPFDPDEFLCAVDRLLEKRASSSPSAPEACSSELAMPVRR